MTHALRPGLIVLHSNQLEVLFELVLRVLKQHPLPPLQAEQVLVQSNGMKHWLELQLASPQGLGICAATRMDLPSTALWRMYRQVLGPQRVSEHMPLDKDALCWRLLRLFAQGLDDPVYAPLKSYLSPHPPAPNQPGAQAPPARRAYQLALQVADVLDGYQNHRADWLQDWARGKDQIRSGRNLVQALPEAQRWQPALWRCLLQDVQLDRPGMAATQAAARARASFQSRASSISIESSRSLRTIRSSSRSSTTLTATAAATSMLESYGSPSSSEGSLHPRPRSRR
jgi:exodeoxyribonuclease V gamma subunit